jgi:hypothetical protein
MGTGPDSGPNEMKRSRRQVGAALSDTISVASLNNSLDEVYSRLGLDLGGVTQGIRVVVLRVLVPSQSSLVHLVERAGTTTLCGAYPLGRLTAPRGLDSDVCPACLEHLKAMWERAASARSDQG